MKAALLDLTSLSLQNCLKLFFSRFLYSNVYTFFEWTLYIRSNSFLIESEPESDSISLRHFSLCVCSVSVLKIASILFVNSPYQPLIVDFQKIQIKQTIWTSKSYSKPTWSQHTKMRKLADLLPYIHSYTKVSLIIIIKKSWYPFPIWSSMIHHFDDFITPWLGKVFDHLLANWGTHVMSHDQQVLFW